MTSQPEKLFRDRLENFERPASDAAWERIEINLNKSPNKSLWMKLAAGLLLLSVAAFLLWPADETAEPSLTKTGNDDKKDVPVEKIIPIQQAPVANNRESSQKKNTDSNKIKVNRKNEMVPVEKTEETSTEIITEPIIIKPEEQPIASTETLPVETSASKTIVYSAEEVNAKFLKKKSTTEATADNKKTSGIQKLIGLAYDLKNTDNGIGTLRQKKDEILTLNFIAKDDKTDKSKN